jgi:hypothetical protein
MAERLAAQIWIGGKISADLVDELCGAIDTQGVSLEWGGGLFQPKTPQDLLQAHVENDEAHTLWVCDDQASWGELNDLESFLEEHAIPYTRQSEGGGSYNGEIIEYRPETDLDCIPIDADGVPTTDVSVLRNVAEALDAAIEQLDAGAVRKATSRLKAARKTLSEQLPPEIPPLPNFEIEGYQLPEENNGQ